MPVCTREELSEAAACFKNFNLSDRASLLIYFNALELAALDGTDYTDELGSGGQLDLDAVCFMALENPAHVPSLPFLVISANNATNAGATVPTDTAELATAIQCNKNFTMDHKAAQQLLLACELGYHTGLP